MPETRKSSTLYEGADGLVLASETAIGSFPVECVMLVSKMIKQLSSDSHDYSKWELGQGESLLLIEPHGGFLVNRVRCDFSIEEAKRFKPLMVDITALMDAEQIAIGAFSPLKGFMNYEEVASVLEHFRLPNGLVWPLPIVLQVHRDEANKFESGETIALMLRDDDIYALLHLQEIYSYDLDEMCFGIFGTNDCNHPGVKYLKKGGEYFLAGEIELIKRLPSAFKSYELMPWQTRTIFETKNWSKVVGFHTRNAIHRAHEHIQIRALEEYNCDGLFVHPVIGPKKSGDYSAEIIIKSYDWMVQHHYPKGKVVLGAFQNYSRYSGPREAVFTALCRKNFGCSHFIVGRDHTGLGNYYHADAAKILFEKLGDIGIVPIFFDEQCFCKLCNTYVEKCVHGISNYLKISGTKSREMLQNQIHPPDWFMREDVSNLIINDIKLGKEVFVK
jgi:ATP sulfurylase